MKTSNPKPPPLPWQDRPILCGLTLVGIIVAWCCIAGGILRVLL